MKTHVLTVSRYFPTTHKRKGDATYFIPKIEQGLGLVNKTCSECALKLGDTRMCKNCFITNGECWEKLHTIRSNYKLWSKRIAEVEQGKAILSLRYWEGKPYNSKQVEFCQLDSNSGIGFQKLIFRSYSNLGDYSVGSYFGGSKTSLPMIENADRDSIFVGSIFPEKKTCKK